MKLKIIAATAAVLVLGACAGVNPYTPPPAYEVAGAGVNINDVTTGAVMAPVPDEKPVTFVNTTPSAPSQGLVEIAGTGTYCPASIAGESIKKWARPGGNAYQGDVSFALNFPGAFAKQVPAQVRSAWAAMVADGGAISGTLPAGGLVCSMMWSIGDGDGSVVHRRWDMVRNETGGDLPADVYATRFGGYIWQLFRPEVCDNWSWRAIRLDQEIVAPEPVEEVVETISTDAGHYKFRVRPWEYDSLSAELKEALAEVTSYEGDESYAFDPGAFSRDYGAALVASWKRGGATTVDREIPMEVSYPDPRRGGQVRGKVFASQWDARNPELIYWEAIVPRGDLGQDPYFEVILSDRPNGCAVLYPRIDPADGKRRLAYKTEGEVGENELLEMFATGENVANVNVVIDCP
ncbi:MAG: hypothetical protein WDZ90_02225 [Candidatus Paceibacterota bacterium]